MTLEPSISRLAVLGAGTMGHGIAYAAAIAGFDVRLYDPSPEALTRARSKMEASGRAGVERGMRTATDVEAALARVAHAATVASAVEQAGLVVEAAPEDIALKLRLLAEVDRLAPAEAIVASNTSSLSVTEMAAVLARPGRFAGMHFFNPVHRMKLVEIVRALETTDETLSTLAVVAARMGKESVIVKDSAGFVTMPNAEESVRKARSPRHDAPALVVCILIGVTACGGSSPTGPNPAPGATITIAAQGVSPREVQISVGQRVLFVNADSRPHTMNSDPHPTHGDCPPIDQVGFLSPNQSKETGNFTTAGACGYHDHNLFPNAAFEGRIVVR